MTAPLLPVLAVQLVANADHVCPEVVSRPGARALHLQRHDDLGTAHAGPDFTPTGALIRRARPMCGQRARRWYRTAVDDRPLCRRCARAADRLAAARGVTRQMAVQHLRPDDVVEALDHARSAAELSECVQLACEAGLIASVIKTPDGPVQLSRLVRAARRRITAPPVIGQRDRNWADRLNPPGSRYPRRYR